MFPTDAHREVLDEMLRLYTNRIPSFQIATGLFAVGTIGIGDD
jgi:hypothetical protein